MKIKMLIVFGFCVGMIFSSMGCRMGSVSIRDNGYYRQNNGSYVNNPGNGTPATYQMAPTSTGLLGPAHQDAFGPGIWGDGAGRPFHWVTQDGQRVPFGKVTPDAYGLGIGMNSFGRPVKAVPGQ